MDDEEGCVALGGLPGSGRHHVLGGVVAADRGDHGRRPGAGA
jgi:hypothetical protein